MLLAPKKERKRNPELCLFSCCEALSVASGLLPFLILPSSRISHASLYHGLCSDDISGQQLPRDNLGKHVHLLG